MIRPAILKYWLVLALSVLGIGTAHAGRTTNFPDEVVVRGAYLAIAGDCSGCHSRPGAKSPFGGGYPVASPLGIIYSSNITPSTVAGIGAYSEVEFDAALRRGIRADGARLYPAMPYTAYARLSDADIQALYAYFMQGVVAVDKRPPQTHLPFPFNIRLSLMLWDALYLKSGELKWANEKSVEWNRGAYLVEALEHCSACHSPRGFLMAEQTDRAFGGAPLGSWYAPNITSDPISGVGSWSRTELTQYLRTGENDKSRAAGAMAEAIDNSLQHLTAPDIAAIAIYLATISPIAHPGESQDSSSYGSAATMEAVLRGDSNPDETSRTGARLFSGYCASCHTATGGGSTDQVFPALFRNTTTGSLRPANVISVILHGIDRQTEGRHAFMPGFDKASYVQPLSDAQILSITTYVMQTFGDPRVSVSARDVSSARAGGVQSSLILWSHYLMAGAVLAVVVAASWLAIRRKGPRKPL